jgi:DNA-binding protein HU-beta
MDGSGVKINKRAIVQMVCEETGVDVATAKVVIESFLGSIQTALTTSHCVGFNGFGTFKRKSRPARVVLNPNHGTKHEVGPRVFVTFKAAPSLRV